jgi:2-amino-4-hydroxy-6-hydroxymethyldihydropteridine diphosphokinase
LGSNISPETNLPEALRLLAQSLSIESVSTAWETPAVGSAGPNFLNAAVLVRMALSETELKINLISQIEDRLGRVRTIDKNAPRTIDIDILMVDAEVVDSNLWTQVYLAVPAAELLPNTASLATGETLSQVARRLFCTTPVKARPEILSRESFV